MSTSYLIAINEFCEIHSIEDSFVFSLGESGLINVVSNESGNFIESSQLNELEKFMRLYYELDINLEGIETITYLLQRIDILQNEINILRNRLRLYEDI